MPKLKPSKLEEQCRIVRGIIKKNMEFRGVSEEELATAAHFTKRTLQNKIHRPETFTLEELWVVADKLKISGEERAQMLGEEIRFELYKVAN